MTDNTSALTPNEREMIAFAATYRNKPIIPAAPEQTAPRLDPSGINGRTTIVDGQVTHANFDKNANLVLRDTSSGGAGTGSPFGMNGTMATDPSTVDVKIGGVGMSAQAARDAVAKGWFSREEYADAVVEAMKPYDPGFTRADLPSFR